MNIEITSEEAKYILECLSHRPWREVHELMPNIMAQLNTPVDPPPSIDKPE